MKKPKTILHTVILKRRKPLEEKLMQKVLLIYIHTLTKNLETYLTKLMEKQVTKENIKPQMTMTKKMEGLIQHITIMKKLIRIYLQRCERFKKSRQKKTMQTKKLLLITDSFYNKNLKKVMCGTTTQTIGYTEKTLVV